MSGDGAPPISGILETSLYVAEMARAVAFYEGLLGLRCMVRGERLTSFDAGRQAVVLLFQRGTTAEDIHGKGGVIPGHEGAGRLHMAFAIPAESYEPWRARLAAAGVNLLGEMRWPAGGRSLYFADPDGHVLEFATPGLWPNY
jgi:catechol 2,3-dioxygenase-like lactoylglutathione lyase family enzyme